jgi:hypothetical protein
MARVLKTKNARATDRDGTGLPDIDVYYRITIGLGRFERKKSRGRGTPWLVYLLHDGTSEELAWD